MSIMSKLFGAAPANTAAAAPATPGNIPPVNTNPAHVTNPTAPAATVAATDNATASPLDQYKTMWETDPNAPAPKVEPSMFANVTPESVSKAAKTNNFAQVATPELMAKITAGGEGAAEAMVEMMQAMSQKSFGDSAFATTKIVEKALEEQQKRFEAMLPTLMKKQNVTENLRNSNPIFNHPAAAPMLEVMKAQVMQKHPNATAAQIQEMAQEYLVSFAAAATPQTQTDAQTSAGIDWSTFAP